MELTAAGRKTLINATQAADQAEQQFLGALGPAAAERFKDALRTLLSSGS